MESRNLSIMMTDIKGFTNKTSGYSRDQIEELLRSHEQLLTPLFTKHNGTVIKTIGDAFLVTFESATSAVEAGMDIQRALSANNTRVSENDKLLVRVAINSGEVNLRDGDIFGEPVNITARVESISLAEHVTFTETVRHLLNKKSIPYTELGEFSLKGIPKPVTLYRVKHDWAVDANLEDGDPGATSSKSGDDNSDNEEVDTSSSSYIIGALIILALIIGGFYLAPKASPLVAVEKMMEAKEWDKALPQLEKLLIKAPSNKEALSMRRECQLALIDIYIKDEKIFEAIETGNKLIKTSASKEEIATHESKLIKAMSAIVGKATASGNVDYALKCLKELDKTMASNFTVMEFHIRLEMQRLENIYKKSLAKLPEGPSILLKSLREQSFEQIIATVRKKISVSSKEVDDGSFKAKIAKFSPLLDYYSGFRMIMRVNTFTATSLLESRSEVGRKAGTPINQLASAYEKDETLRERQEIGSALVGLLKFYNVDPSGMRDDSAIRLRRTISTFLIDWMAPLLVTESLKGTTVVDGARASEASYRLRHNTELILQASGKLKMLDKKALLRHDFKWFLKHERNDSALRTRLELCEKEVFAEKDTALTTEFEAVIQDLKNRLKIKWGEK